MARNSVLEDSDIEVGRVYIHMPEDYSNRYLLTEILRADGSNMYRDRVMLRRLSDGVADGDPFDHNLEDLKRSFIVVPTEEQTLLKRNALILGMVRVAGQSTELTELLVELEV